MSRLNRGEVVFAIPSRQRSFVVAIQSTVQDPILAVAAPILGPNGRVIGALSFGFDADEECTRALAQTNFGQTGETFAFDKNAVLLSNIRNRHDLEALGLLEANQQCALNVEVRIPPTSGESEQGDAAIRPLTAMAAHAIGGNTGTNVKGYTNFAGKKVVGAWTWLPGYEFGVGTEINYAEAYGPLSYIVRSFAFLIGVVSILSIGIVSSSLRIFQLQKRIEGEQFGAYRLGEKIGEGGMGEVYKAFHNRLQRPAAVKLLTNADGNPSTTARFEREVQLTCSLTHPNTIQVFDFGVSTGGVFYYAMELLDGRTVQQIVQATGVICPARTVHILQQVCGSLQEAHEKGLIHRDIKPSNIMVSQRAGLSDFVTVLDFGIAKPIEPSKKQDVTRAEMVIGTPHFMAPERVIAPETVDARSDVFSFGAVAFYMLVGRHPFEGDNSIEILRQSTTSDGVFPSGFGNQSIPPELDRLIYDCLSRDPSSRPQTMNAIYLKLDEIATEHEWTAAEAAAWWDAYQSR